MTKKQLGAFGIIIMVGTILLALFIINPITLGKGLLLALLFIIGLCMCLEAGTEKK